jgi:sulfotransferase family protein
MERFFGTQIIDRRFLRECEGFRNKVIAYHSDSPSMCIRYTAEELGRETDVWLQSLRSRSFSGQEIYRSAREFVDRLFAIHCQRMNKPYWINKTPGLLNHLDGLARLYPGAKCIHIIRDGRDVAVSNLGQKWGPNNVHEAARRWKNLMREGRKALEKKRLNFIEIRYENLIRSPEASLERILEFLDLEGIPQQILSHIKVHDRSIGAWRTGFTAKDRKIFARAAGDLLIDLGYEQNYFWSS